MSKEFDKICNTTRDANNRRKRVENVVNAFVDAVGEAEKFKFKLYLESHQADVTSI